MVLKKFKKTKSIEKETNRELKKIKKLKNEFLILDKKFEKGKLNSAETNRYFKLKEDIEKMSKKYVLKDGKLVINTADKNNDSETDINEQQQTVQDVPENNNNVHHQENIVEQRANTQRVDEQSVNSNAVNEAQRMGLIQQQQREELLRRKALEQEQLHQQQQEREELLRRKALEQEQLHQQQQREEMLRRQAIEQEEMRQLHQQQKAQEQVVEREPKELIVRINIRDAPEMSMRILDTEVLNFINGLEIARDENKMFKFGNFFLNLSELIYVYFEDVKEHV